MLAILGGLGAAVAWAAGVLCAARASRLVPPESLLAVVMTAGLVVTAPWALAVDRPDVGGGSALWLLVGGGGNVLGLLLAYAAYRVGKVGLVAPITSTEGAIAALVAVVAGERLSAGIGVTLGVIAVGIALAAAARVEEAEVRRADLRAALLALAAAVSFGFSLYGTGRVGDELGIAWAVLPPRLVGFVVIALPLVLAGRLRMTRRALPLALVMAASEVVGFASYAFGARHGLAVSAVLASQFAGLAALAGFLLFRERLAPVQVAGVVTILAGVTALGILNS